MGCYHVSFYHHAMKYLLLHKPKKIILCIKCKTKTSTKDLTEVTKKNGRLMMKGLCDACGVKKTSLVKQCGGGRKLDIHSLTGKLPEHKNGWTPPVYKYMGPYNPLDKQLEYNTRTQEKYWSDMSNQRTRSMKLALSTISVMTWVRLTRPQSSHSLSLLTGARGVMGRRITSSLFPSHHPLLPPRMSREDY